MVSSSSLSRLVAIAFSTLPAVVFSGNAGSFADGGNMQISAMMMFLGNDEKVYILDKAEGNAAQINGHPAWGAVWDINTHQIDLMDVRTNTFCSSGHHLPNGSFVTLGGNGAVGRGGALGSSRNPDNNSASWDATYQDFDGRKSMRILNPCTSSSDFTSQDCAWYDDPSVLSMYDARWYSSAEATATGEVVIIGGFSGGGYVNREVPNNVFVGGSETTYEYYPSRPQQPQIFGFLADTSGLNAYAHTFLMPDGRLFVQSNVSTVLFDHNANLETRLPPMPGGVVRVYPASGAVAMLPLTPANNYTPTVIFCGGSNMPEEAYGNYSWPFINTWLYPASQDCQRITPEPTDGSSPVYVQDDDMLEGRTMGQFIILPDGTLMVVNGGLNGTAGYSDMTLLTPVGQMPFGQSLATGPVLSPAIYNPNAPAGQRWSRTGFQASKFPRLYHSSAILLPDASVLISGSNPNMDVNLTAIYPTTYEAEIFYPSYFSSPTRPVVSGVPKTLSYGGAPFDITLTASSYTGSANDAADATNIVLHRSGFTTHAMNMGQRLLQLNNTYTVQTDGSITFHVSQVPPNPNLFTPGPAFLFVVVKGIPGNGTYVIVGNGVIGTQPTSPAGELPPSVRVDSAAGSGGNNSGSGGTNVNANGNSTTHASMSKATIIGSVAGAIALLGIIGAVLGVILARRRKSKSGGILRSPTVTRALSGIGGGRGVGSSRKKEGDFIPLQQDNYSQAWNNASVGSFNPYQEEQQQQQHGGMHYDDVGRGNTSFDSRYDPYSRQPMEVPVREQEYYQAPVQAYGAGAGGPYNTRGGGQDAYGRAQHYR